MYEDPFGCQVAHHGYNLIYFPGQTKFNELYQKARQNAVLLSQ